MPKTALQSMNFDKWMSLASDDPDAFERMRQQVVTEFINNTSTHRRQRLRCLQWRIDMIRKRSKTPMAACQKLYSMMWDSLLEHKEALDNIHAVQRKRNQVLKTARIIPFTTRPI